MYLKKIEAIGFKSFANKVFFDLSEGVTGFVGPNGCGKSNVVDAVKWGLGEQRISSLRGDCMQDVIFKGNGRRPAMNFSEVSLHFSNTCGTLPIDFEEVVVTRRLYRSGESEYLLNRTSCRLKDIRALFLDTGVGVSAYSMMEQGKIDSVLKTDPVSRRAIFEEASGISRFKSRRKEAERKLEKTQANLLRLGDIIDELEKRVRSLKNQAGRARSYLKLTDRLKALKKGFFLHQYQVRREEELQLREKMNRADEALENSTACLSQNKQELFRLENELNIMSEELHVDKTGLAEARTALEETEGKIGYLERRVGELKKEALEVDDRKQHLVTNEEQQSRDLDEMLKRLEVLGKEEQEVLEEAAACSREVEEVGRTSSQARRELDQLEAQAFSLTRKEVALKNQVVEAETNARTTSSELTRLGRRQNGLVQDLRSVVIGLRRVDTTALDLEGKKARLQKQLDEGRQRARTEEEKLRQIDQGLKKVESAHIKGESRIEVLQDLIDRREGVSSGVKEVLLEAGKEGSGLSFIKGMLGELLEVSVEYSAALEAALGDTVEALVVDDLSQAEQIMNYLSQGNPGRVKILPLSELNRLIPPLPSRDGTLANQVKGQIAAIEPAIKTLLGEVRIIDREEILGRRESAAGTAVTLQGDRVSRFGVLSVGKAPREPGVISRRSELSALSAERDRLKEELQVLAHQRGGLEISLNEANRANRDISLQIEQLEREMAGLIKEQEKDRERWAHLRRAYRLNTREIYDGFQTLQELKSRLTDCLQEMAQSRGELEAVNRRFQEAQQRYEERQAQREALAEKSRKIELRRAQFSERREGMDKERALIDKNLSEVKARLADLVRDQERIARTREEMSVQLEEMKERSEMLLAKRSELSQAVTDREAQLEVEKNRCTQTREAVSQAETALEEARCLVDDLRVDIRELQVRKEGLVEKAREELDIDLDLELDSDQGSDDQGSDDQGSDETEADEESQPDDQQSDAKQEVEEDGAEDEPLDEPDWQSVEEEIELIRERLSRMGNVNLDAINELKDVEERCASLITQRDDLLHSIKSLEELIVTLNKESRQKFVETFETVRGHFNEIFRKLFQGGRADVRLKEGEDVLEAGIEIIAGPPGKDPQSISLLSGGEKTLTAVGLLFALFKSRPSPFCILDEVDAALDDINIERFCTLLGEYATDSQFIIITHSKRTMSYCNFLYGITMQEDGVTTRIPLDLENYEDRVA